MDSLFEEITDEDLAAARLVLDQLYQNLRTIEKSISQQEGNI